jgi:hypothetical protein
MRNVSPRAKIGVEIRDGYLRQPQTEEEVAWSDAASFAMIAEESWGWQTASDSEHAEIFVDRKCLSD